MEMFREIRWKAFIRAGAQKNAETVLRRIEKALGREISMVTIAPSRRDEGLFEIVFTSPLGIERVQDAVFESLRQGDKLSYEWSVRPPQDYKGGKWDFAASATRRLRISGIEALDFEIANYSMPT